MAKLTDETLKSKILQVTEKPLSANRTLLANATLQTETTSSKSTSSCKFFNSTPSLIYLIARTYVGQTLATTTPEPTTITVTVPGTTSPVTSLLSINTAPYGGSKEPIIIDLNGNSQSFTFEIQAPCQQYINFFLIGLYSKYMNVLLRTGRSIIWPFLGFFISPV